MVLIFVERYFFCRQLLFFADIGTLYLVYLDIAFIVDIRAFFEDKLIGPFLIDRYFYS